MRGREDVCWSPTLTVILPVYLFFKENICYMVIYGLIFENVSSMWGTLSWYKCTIKMHEHKMTSINSPRYPGIDIKKLRVCCIAHFRSKKNLFSSYISSRGKAGYTGLISGPIIKSNEINHKTTCSSSLMQWSRKSNFSKKKF